MNITIAYSNKEEILPLLPIMNNEINPKEFKFEFIQIREDDIKFKYENYDLFYLPLPLLNYIDIKIISNGAMVVNELGLSDNITKEVCASSNSTEYYLLKILTGTKALPNSKPDCSGSKFVTNNYKMSLSDLWRNNCQDLPIVLRLIGSNLSDDILSKIKIIIRESASIQENRGLIASYSRELGLKGRKAIDCFFELCRKKNLCTVTNYKLL
ncbi:hypothetical protein DFR86_05565 [Acidianus sulfidivorans JP7]|uniref:hypothetical protein n=1 Tax=Acidianus sulfidivorans TaxID=312539 RepID=UPI0013A56942|nr:hypothetical protein [Acidianus sulfidivorans]AWR97081.2 hypothetical protein DFR86_05565 [Acidianus sulfidivorans JP7]